MVLGRIFPKITKFYLDGSPAEAEIAYPTRFGAFIFDLADRKNKLPPDPEGVIYITKGYPSALQIKWALETSKEEIFADTLNF